MHSFNETIRWTQAIILQGSRVLEAHSDQSRPCRICDRARVEEQFFLNACGKAVRWSEALSNEGKDSSVRDYLPVLALRKFRGEMDSTSIRNLREHEEEYLRTEGKPLDDEIVDSSAKSGGVKILVEPGITVLRHGDVIVGGRVSVQETIKVANAFNSELVDAQRRFARARTPLLKGAEPDDYPHVFAGYELT